MGEEELGGNPNGNWLSASGCPGLLSSRCLSFLCALLHSHFSVKTHLAFVSRVSIRLQTFLTGRSIPFHHVHTEGSAYTITMLSFEVIEASLLLSTLSVVLMDPILHQ